MEITLQAEERAAFGKANSKLRKAGTLPAVLYGRGKDSMNLQLAFKEFEKAYKQAGENTIVDLVISGKTHKKVLIHEVAKHYMKNEPIHVDFYEVDLSRKIHAKIPIILTGVSPAVKDFAGILIKNISELEVEALPGDLPHAIEVGLERLAALDDRIRVKDLNLGDKVKVLSHADDTIALVQPPRTEEELAELEKPTAEAEQAAIKELGAEETPKAEGATEGEAAKKEKEAVPSGEKKEDKKKE